MSVKNEVHAVRHSVGLSRLGHVHYLAITGPRAFEAVDSLVSGLLRVRDGQLMHTLMLTEDARPFADAYVARNDEEFLLIADGPLREDLIAHVRSHLPSDGSAQLEDRSASHSIIGVDGPYAWELLGATLDPEVIGLPFLTFYHHRQWLCFRAGRTGEYGYGVIGPRGDIDELEQRMQTVGAAYDLANVGLEALDQCALENWFFNIRREGRADVTPIELQLQWRVSYRKEFIGAAALRQRRAAGAAVRLTCLIAGGKVAAGDMVVIGDMRAGAVVNAGYSDVRGDWIALALLDRSVAYPGIDCQVGATKARTVSPPVLQNRSLVVSPQLHSYATRAEYPAPPLFAR
jgi:glycine cleavage system aminomethyltransferase T